MSNLYLYIYDISNGFKCIWHTSIVAYNLEYYFGIDGIQVSASTRIFSLLFFNLLMIN